MLIKQTTLSAKNIVNLKNDIPWYFQKIYFIWPTFRPIDMSWSRFLREPISRYINTTIFLNIERCVGSFILFWTWILSRILYNLKRFSYFSFSSHCIFLSSIFFFRSFLIKFSLGHLYTILSVRDTERDHA